MRVPARAALALAAALTGPPVGAQPRSSAAPHLVLLGGRVFTADPARPWTEALAVRGERILAVGTTREIEALAGARTRRIRLGGRTVVPGFNDAHDHVGQHGPPSTAFTADPALAPDPGLAAVLDSITAVARRTPPGRWVETAVGGRVFDDPRATRATLDSVAPDRPVWVAGWSGHGALLNTAALRATGLLDAPDPLGGWLARDAGGRPTGRIDEYALYGANRRLAMLRGRAGLAAAFRARGAEALRTGITTVQDMASQYALDDVRALARGGQALPVRHRVMRFPQTAAPGGRIAEWRIEGADTALARHTHVSGVKWILDGTPIDRLALMRQPYADRPGWYGRANFPFDTLRALLRDALRRGEQPLLHAVGDSTIALVFAAMRAEAPDSAWRRLRPRLEHADLLGRDQLADVRALGMVVVQNPTHLALPGLMRARWGAERLARVDLMRTLVDSGVPLAIGSDGPFPPGLNLLLATQHPNVPAEALTREQAVAAYTRGSAYAEFAERDKGTLAPGMLADFAVLSQDVFTVPPDALPGTVSLLTVVGGRVAYDALAARPPGRARPR
jgi:predicted amidohydrolase YtcJ